MSSVPFMLCSGARPSTTRRLRASLHWVPDSYSLSSLRWVSLMASVIETSNPNGGDCLVRNTIIAYVLIGLTKVRSCRHETHHKRRRLAVKNGGSSSSVLDSNTGHASRAHHTSFYKKPNSRKSRPEGTSNGPLHLVSWPLQTRACMCDAYHPRIPIYRSPSK